MATIRLVRAATAPVANQSQLTPPPDAYTPKLPIAEADLDMQRTSGFRNRQCQGPATLNPEDNASATQSEEPHAPTSNDELAESRGIIALDL